MAKDRKRARTKAHIPFPGLSLTPQIVFNASWSWPKTPLAPKRAMITERRCKYAACWFGCAGGDVFNNFNPARMDKILQLFRDLFSRLLAAAKKHPENRQEHQNEWR